MDASVETEILNKYNLTSLYPAAWPEEKDAADEEALSDDEGPPPAAAVAAAAAVRRSRSRYSVLEDRSRFSRQVPGAERSKDGVETLVQKDEQDPLGVYPSVVQVLRQRALAVEDDIKLRMHSSTRLPPQDALG